MALDDKDLKNIKNLVELVMEDKTRKIVEEVIDKKIGFLPSKDDFYNMMDKVMGELATIRQELFMINHRVNNHEDRIDCLEKKVAM
jgi:hypothetical protein